MRDHQPIHEKALDAPAWPWMEGDRSRRRIVRAALATAAVLHVAAFAVHWPALQTPLERAMEDHGPIFVLRQVRFLPPPPPSVDLPKPPARTVPLPDPTPEEPEVIREHTVGSEVPLDDVWVPASPSDIPAPPRPAQPRVYQVGVDIAPPRVIHRVQPIYTRAALAARLQGVVILEAVIDTEGRVASLEVLRGLGLGLTESAVAAVRQWRFEPSTANGRPVRVLYRLTVVFRIE